LFLFVFFDILGAEVYELLDGEFTYGEVLVFFRFIVLLSNFFHLVKLFILVKKSNILIVSFIVFSQIFFNFLCFSFAFLSIIGVAEIFLKFNAVNC